jgi:hypothetical protein
VQYKQFLLRFCIGWLPTRSAVFRGEFHFISAEAGLVMFGVVVVCGVFQPYIPIPTYVQLTFFHQHSLKISSTSLYLPFVAALTSSLAVSRCLLLEEKDLILLRRHWLHRTFLLLEEKDSDHKLAYILRRRSFHVLQVEVLLIQRSGFGLHKISLKNKDLKIWFDRRRNHY